MPRASVGVNAACFALLAWLYGGDLYDVTRARSSEVAALAALPSVPFAALLLVAALAGAVITGVGITQKKDASWKGYRVMPIIAVLGLFVDLFIVSADKSPFSSFARAGAAIELFESKASALASPTAVPADTASLEALLPELGEAPWLVKGEVQKAWKLEVTGDCTGPRTEANGAGAGTLLYCAAADRSQAWITAVGLPREERFGAPQLVTTGGQPLVAVVERQPAETPPDAQAPEMPGEAPPPPMYFEGDAGNLAPVP